ncbi:MAG: endospore germination permease, partial [Firmicutes bacterium]|nr:endospore germination permease [Bacillota bacterium]
MQEKGRVSPGQVWLLIFGFMVGSAILLPNAPAAKRDAWLAVPLGEGLGIAMAFIYTGLLARFPGKTLVEAATCALGTWLGKFVGLLYFWFALHLGSLVLRNSWEFLAATVLRQTPPPATAIVLMLLVWYATRGGVEVIARTAQLLVPLVIIIPTLFIVAMPSHVNLRNLLPILENGWVPLLKGSLQTATFPAGETILFTMILPYMKPAGEARRVTVSAIAATAVLGTLVVGRDVAVLGSLREHLSYPAYDGVSMVTIANFVEGLEALLVALWIVGTFTKITVCHYAAALSLAQLTGLKDYRPLTGPLAAMILVLSFWVYPNAVAMNSFAATTWVPYAFVFELIIPLL